MESEFQLQYIHSTFPKRGTLLFLHRDPLFGSHVSGTEQKVSGKILYRPRSDSLFPAFSSLPSTKARWSRRQSLGLGHRFLFPVPPTSSKDTYHGWYYDSLLGWPHSCESYSGLLSTDPDTQLPRKHPRLAPPSSSPSIVAAAQKFQHRGYKAESQRFRQLSNGLQAPQGGGGNSLAKSCHPVLGLSSAFLRSGDGVGERVTNRKRV